MSSKDIWKELDYFSRGENWGDPDKISWDLLRMLDRFRGEVGKPFILTSAAYATSGHSSKSYHYKGMAVDGRFVDSLTLKPIKMAEAIEIALKAPFGGIGIYPWWSGGVGFHFDIRPIVSKRAVWISPNPGRYEPVTAKTLVEILSAIV